MKKFVDWCKAVVKGFLDNHCSLHAAGLTYFSMLALVPVLCCIIVLAKAAHVDQYAREQINGRIDAMIAEVEKGLPIVLCQHVPFFSPGIALAHARSHTSDVALNELLIPLASRDFKKQAEDKVTADFIRYLKSEPLLKAILAGHYHCGMCDRFSPTAMQYVVGGNFLFHGQEVLFT